MDPDLKIEFEQAERSIENDLGLSAQYKASADQKQRLLNIARQESTRAEHYKQLYEDEHRQHQLDKQADQAYIAKLEARIAELEARPTNVYADNFIETLNAKKVLFPQQRHPGKRNKKHIEDSSQLFLELWKNNQTAIS